MRQRPTAEPSNQYKLSHFAVTAYIPRRLRQSCHGYTACVMWRRMEAAVYLAPKARNACSKVAADQAQSAPVPRSPPPPGAAVTHAAWQRERRRQDTPPSRRLAVPCISWAVPRYSKRSAGPTRLDRCEYGADAGTPPWAAPGFDCPLSEAVSGGGADGVDQPGVLGGVGEAGVLVGGHGRALGVEDAARYKINQSGYGGQGSTWGTRAEGKRCKGGGGGVSGRIIGALAACVMVGGSEREQPPAARVHRL